MLEWGEADFLGTFADAYRELNDAGRQFGNAFEEKLPTREEHFCMLKGDLKCL